MRRWFLFVLICALASGVWTWALLRSHNILFFNQFWEPFETTYFGFRYSGLDFLMNRRQLEHDKIVPLNERWRQRVVSLKTFSPSKISFRLRSTGGFVSILLMNPDKIEGIRLSGHPVFRSLLYSSDFHEKFLSQRPVDLELPKDQWSKVQISYKNHSLVVQLNQKVVQVPYDGSSMGRVAFEFYRTSITDFTVDEGGSHFPLPFVRQERFLGFFLLNFLLFSVLSLPVPRRIPQLFFATGLLWASFDVFYWSKIPMTVRISDLSSAKPGFTTGPDLEIVRHKIFRSWFMLLGGTVATPGDLLRKHGEFKRLIGFRINDKTGVKSFRDGVLDRTPERSPGERRLLFVGGSMSGGYGLTSDSLSYDHVLLKELRRNGIDAKIGILSRPSPFTSANESPALEKLVRTFSPELVILEVFPMFMKQELLEDTILKIKALKVSIVLLRTVRDWPMLGPELLHVVKKIEKNDRLASVARRLRVHLLDPGPVFLDEKTYLSGYLFWDALHLTDLGHDIFGHYLSGALLEYLTPGS